MDTQLAEIRKAAAYTMPDRKEALCLKCNKTVKLEDTTVVATHKMYARRCNKCGETIESCFFD